MTISEILSKVSSTANKAGKVKILIDNRSRMLDEIFEYAYNPDKMFGVTSNQVVGKTIEKLSSFDIDECWNLTRDILDMLVTRKRTGNDAVNSILSIMSIMNPECQVILMNILDKNLKIGISYETYQKEVMGVKATKFQVTLAQHLEDVKGVNPVDGSYFASRKCDGVRCVAFVNTGRGEVIFKSRQGKEFTTLDNLKPAVLEFCKNMVGDWVLDGELCKIDENGDEHFDQIVGECKKKNYTIEECCYQLFDVTTKDIFEGVVQGGMEFERRYDFLKTTEECYEKGDSKCFVKVLGQELLTCQEDFDRWEKKVADGNWEGFMLRKNVTFETGRTKNLLKVKKFHDAEFKVIGVTFAELTTAEPGIGNVTYTGVDALQIEYKGNKVKVGSGLTKDQRKEWYAHPNEIVGKTICVKYFQESQDKDGNYSLRFPTLKYVYQGERNV